MKNSQENTLVIITGPTASGKSAVAAQLASRLGCDVISADSRQIYQGLPIGTAVPSTEERAMAKHHFVEILPLDAQYSAAQYRDDVIALLPALWTKSPIQVMCGGSMMYIDAICYGIDELPTISESVRKRVLEIYDEHGLYGIRQMLQLLDPASYEKVDAQNPRRNIHALEICLQSGLPASQLLTGKKQKPPFRIIKIALDREREDLFNRINRRVELMVDKGLEAEAKAVYPMRDLNSLNTVGYKEMFKYFDGEWDLSTAIARIQKNTRVYAKKQLTWLKKDNETIWMPANSPIEEIMGIIAD